MKKDKHLAATAKRHGDLHAENACGPVTAMNADNIMERKKMHIKRIVCTLVLATLYAGKVYAQTDLQEMYDIMRGHPTTTIEVSYSDPWGSTYYFTDIYHPIKNGAITASGFYTEIEREICFWHNSKLRNWNLHVEWNGGQYAANTWQTGISYLFHNIDYSNILSIGLYYRHEKFAQDNQYNKIPLQLSLVCRSNKLAGVEGLSFLGIMDLYGNTTTWIEELKPTTTHVSMLCESQIWYNIGRHFGCPNLHAGGEIEIGYNFDGGYHTDIDFMKNKGLTVTPAVGLKWIFL